VEFTNNPVLKSHFFVIILTRGGNGCPEWVKFSSENGYVFRDKSGFSFSRFVTNFLVELDYLWSLNFQVS
jgi:hypothetical protein